MAHTVLITGVGGFLGRHVARHCARLGWRVVGTDLLPDAGGAEQDLAVYRPLELPSPAFRELLRQEAPHFLMHCAGRASVPQSMTDPAADFAGSVALTFSLLNDLRLELPSCRFIFLSSAAIYGNPVALPVREEQAPSPLSPYGFHKWQCEQLCAEFSAIYGLFTASVRIFSAYGEGLRRQVMWDLCRKAIAESAVCLQGTGRESRDFIHAADVAQGLVAVATKAPMKGEIYNLSSGREVTIAELSVLALAALGIEKRIEFDGVVPAGNPLNWRAEMSRISALGFQPKISLEDGVRAFAAWCRTELASR